MEMRAPLPRPDRAVADARTSADMADWLALLQCTHWQCHGQQCPGGDHAFCSEAEAWGQGTPWEGMQPRLRGFMQLARWHSARMATERGRASF